MTGITPQTYTGEDATITISGQATTVVGIGDFSLTLDRGTVEQELVGSAGNYFTQGALSVEGSFTNCKWAGDVIDATLGALINKGIIAVSGNSGIASLHFYLKSCQITNFDLTLGDASTITEGSIDFTMLDPYNIAKENLVSGARIYANYS